MEFSGKSTGVGCHFLLQEIFPTQGLNLGLLHCRQTVYRLGHQGSSQLFSIEKIKIEDVRDMFYGQMLQKNKAKNIHLEKLIFKI